MNLTKILCKDELRPAMMLAVLVDGYIYATNAHLGIRIKLDTVPGYTVKTDGKVFDKNALTILAKGKEVVFEQDYFVIKQGAFKGKHFYSGTIDSSRITMDYDSDTRHADDTKYPDLAAIIKETENAKEHELSEIGINYKFLSDISEVFVYNGSEKNVRLKFTGAHKAILVSPSSNTGVDQVGIIMPVMLRKET